MWPLFCTTKLVYQRTTTPTISMLPLLQVIFVPLKALNNVTTQATALAITGHETIALIITALSLTFGFGGCALASDRSVIKALSDFEKASLCIWIFFYVWTTIRVLVWNLKGVRPAEKAEVKLD